MVQTTVRLPEKLYSELKQEAKQRGQTMNSYIVSLLWARKADGAKLVFYQGQHE